MHELQLPSNYFAGAKALNSNAVKQFPAVSEESQTCSVHVVYYVLVLLLLLFCCFFFWVVVAFNKQLQSNVISVNL